MLKRIRFYLFLLGSAFALVLAIVVFNQTMLLVQFAGNINPVLGQVVLILLLTFYAFALGVPLIALARLPKPMRPPPEDDPEAAQAYLQALSKRLSSNPHLADTPEITSDPETVASAIATLDDKANEIIRKNASTVFISTAISQNGRLDALMVLGLQSRMIWELAHLYNQRPHWREILSLYNNVTVTTFLAAQIDDLDLRERIEPIVRSAIGSGFASTLPGLNVVGTILITSILEGTANAFLTLRVGVICRKYCGALVKPERKGLTRSATLEAAALLGNIVVKSSSLVSRAIIGAAAKSSGEAAKGTFSKMTKGMTGFFRPESQEDEPARP